MKLSKAQSVFLCVLLLFEGFILMGFEMLSSRFMNPYFGSSIETWACIISVVLCSMALGYFAGGFLSSRPNTHSCLVIATIISGLYLIFVSLYANKALLWVIIAYDVRFFSTLLASIVLLAVPVFFMSFWSPMVVGILSRNSGLGVSIAGYVYGVSTIGNVLGTLCTAFLLVPSLGSSAISLSFGIGLLVIAALYLMVISRTWERIAKPKTFFFTGLLIVAIGSPSDVRSGLRLEARYPEGVFLESRDIFYFTEMTSDVITQVNNGTRKIFHRFDGCGPTGFTQISAGIFAVACHLEGSIRILDSTATLQRVIRRSESGLKLRNPNDINGDGFGGAFFTDPGTFSVGAGPVGRVFRLTPDWRVELVASHLTYPNGVAFNSARNLLFVSEHLKKRVVAISLSGSFKEDKDRLIVVDFSTLPISNGWGRLGGPDGLRILPGGEIATAIYGGSSIAVIHRCGKISWLFGYPRYTTSLGYQDGVLIVAGADSNDRYPYKGSVTRSKFEVVSVCGLGVDAE